ncbi:MAG: ATP-binding protein [Phycisphaeraceae bacterium]
MADSPTKVLSIPSDLNAAWNAQQKVMEEVKARGYSENAVFAIRLALDEALNNAISHGNRRDKSKKVHIEYTIGDAAVTITVSDEGTGFDPHHVPDPTLDEFLERPHGRGIMLMRAYMTDVRFGQDGNSVTLIKTRNCALPLAKKQA